MDKPADCSNLTIHQHKIFNFPEDHVTLTSNFDSGNLAKAERIGTGIYHLYTGPDCVGTKAENSCRT